MHIKELTSLDEMLAVFPVMSQMYPNLTYDEFSKIIPMRIKTGYRMIAAYEDHICIATAGFWIGYRFYCGPFLQLDNMVVDKEIRSKGAGKALVDWVKALAKKEGCNRVILDSYVENFDAHRFFYREGFIIRGYHFNYMVS